MNVARSRNWLHIAQCLEPANKELWNPWRWELMCSQMSLTDITSPIWFFIVFESFMTNRVAGIYLQSLFLIEGYHTSCVMTGNLYNSPKISTTFWKEFSLMGNILFPKRATRMRSLFFQGGSWGEPVGSAARNELWRQVNIWDRVLQAFPLVFWKKCLKS